MDQVRAASRALAERHAKQAAPAAEPTFLDYAERPRHDGWTLRSALVRVAQRDPILAGAVLEAVRRCDTALHPLRRGLERHLVAPGPGPDGVAEPRAIGLGRFLADTADREADRDQVIAAYAGHSPLDDEEILALPLVPAVLLLDELGELAARWAITAEDPVPGAELDRLCRDAWAALDRAGAPIEQGPPPGARSRRG